MTGPYRLVASTAKNVIVDRDGEEAAPMNDRYSHGPNRELEDPDNQDEADDINIPSNYENLADNRDEDPPASRAQEPHRYVFRLVVVV